MIFKLCWFFCCYSHAQAHSHAPSSAFLPSPPARCFLFICATFTDFLRFYNFVYVFRASLSMCVCVCVANGIFLAAFPPCTIIKFSRCGCCPKNRQSFVSSFDFRLRNYAKMFFFVIIACQGVECCSFSSDSTDLELLKCLSCLSAVQGRYDE